MPRVIRRVAGTIRRIVATSGALVVIGSVALTVGAGLIGAAYLIGHVVGWTHAAYFAAGGLVQIVGARITGWNRTRHLREVLHWFDRHDVARRFVDLPSPEDRARQGLP